MERQLTKRRWELAYRFVGVSSSLTTQGFVISLKGLGFPLSSTLNTTVESPCSPCARCCADNNLGGKRR